MMTIRQFDDDETCTSCRQTRPDVKPRYSFGIYAGRLCTPCCSYYRDRCGLDGEQGNPTTLDKYVAGGPAAVWGEDAQPPAQLGR